MKKENRFIKKTCSFYVSEYHLVTMLLPYIKKKVEEKVEIKTVLEENIEVNMEKLISNINLDAKYKKAILNMNWKSFQIYKYPKIEEALSENETDAPMNIIISGKYDYVEMMSKNIEKIIIKNQIKRKITINNCYEVIEFNDELKAVLNRYEKILNTSGEHDIDEVFGVYGRREQKGHDMKI